MSLGERYGHIRVFFDAWILPLLRKFVVLGILSYFFLEQTDLSLVPRYVEKELQAQFLWACGLFALNMFAGVIMFIIQVRWSGVVIEKPVMFQWIIASLVYSIFVWIFNFKFFIKPSYSILGIYPNFITDEMMRRFLFYS